MNLRIKNKYILAIATVVILCTLFIRNCNNEVSTGEITYDPALQYEYETVRDTVTTVVTQTKIDTIVIEIEETINNIMDKTETIVKEVVRERDSMVVRIVELEQVPNITVYDTVRVYVPIQPDSVTIYNVWEYETFDGKVTRSTRDTVQTSKVYRHYAQKYIMK